MNTIKRIKDKNTWEQILFLPLVRLTMKSVLMEILISMDRVALMVLCLLKEVSSIKMKPQDSQVKYQSMTNGEIQISITMSRMLVQRAQQLILKFSDKLWRIRNHPILGLIVGLLIALWTMLLKQTLDGKSQHDINL